jgi:NAD(P)-dependent dehydrogenase (short-subunit alcohol dehydrogenase family)
MVDGGVDVGTPADMFSLVGRRAIVTGASSGLGARFARVLAAAGAEVIATARRGDRLRALAGLDPLIRPIECDIDDPEARERLVSEATSDARRIDILVNNAGVSGHLDAMAETTHDFARVLSVNLVAAFDLSRATVAATDIRRGISIVNVASILGLVSGAPLAGAGYSASKAGLVGLTRELAGQWGRDGVRVNALAPGWFRTEMTGTLLTEPTSAQWVQRNTLLGRGGEEHELDAALLFLAAPASSYCTGQVVVIDGGWTAR